MEITMPGGKGPSDNPQARNTVEQGKTTANRAADQAKEGARAAADSASDFARDAYDKGKSAVDQAGEAAGRVAAQAVAAQAKEAARDAVDSASDLARNAYDKGAQYVRDGLERYPEAGRYLDEGRRYVSEGSRAVSRPVEENPLLAILMAGAAGYLLAYLIHGGSGSRRESVPDYARTRGYNDHRRNF